MKEWFKKYWWAILIILALPIVINFILLIPAFSPIVGEGTDWLSFWGGYLGAIISAGVAFIILHIQRKEDEEQNKKNRDENEKQNKTNRDLQLNIMQYQQQSQWLNNFREISLEYCYAFNSNDLVMISNMMWNNPQDAFNLLKGIFDCIDKSRTKFAFIRKQDKESNNLAMYINERSSAYKDALNDFQWIVLYFKAFPQAYRCKAQFIQYLQSNTNINANITHILQLSQTQIEQIVNGNNYKYFNDIFLSIFAGLDKIGFDIQDKLYEYIKQEQERIDNILTKDLN